MQKIVPLCALVAVTLHGCGSASANANTYQIVLNDHSYDPRYCLAVPSKTPAKGINVALIECDSAGDEASVDQWLIYPTSQNVKPASDATLCLTTFDSSGPNAIIPILWPCDQTWHTYQTWTWGAGQKFTNVKSGMILGLPDLTKQLQWVYEEMADPSHDITWNIVKFNTATSMPGHQVQV